MFIDSKAVRLGAGLCEKLFFKIEKQKTNNFEKL